MSAIATRYIRTYQALHRPDWLFEILPVGHGGLQFGWLGRWASPPRETLEAYSGGLVSPDSRMVLNAPAGEGPALSLTCSIAFGQNYQAVGVPRQTASPDNDPGL